MKKGRIAVFIAVALLLLFFLPIPGGTYADGGTRVYRALTYTVVAWNKRIAELGPDGGAGQTVRYRKTSVFWFPDNNRQIDELWQLETAGGGSGEK